MSDNQCQKKRAEECVDMFELANCSHICKEVIDIEYLSTKIIELTNSQEILKKKTE